MAPMTHSGRWQMSYRLDRRKLSSPSKQGDISRISVSANLSHEVRRRNTSKTRSKTCDNYSLFKENTFREQPSNVSFTEKIPYAHSNISSETKSHRRHGRFSANCWLYFVFISVVLLCEFVGKSLGFCPTGCNCNDINVDCTNAELDVVPILLNPRTVTINLANNRITSVQESFIFYTDLTFLNLANNDLNTIGTKSFEVQKVLKTLLLNDNQITSLQEDSFYGLSELENLTLNNNVLTHIDHKAFKGLYSLKTLYLERNRIKDIASQGFEGLYNIRAISLMSNRLEKVPVSSLTGLRSIQELNLSDNKISIVPESAFRNLADLTYLNLARNNLSLIHPDAFLGLAKLRALDVRDNRLNVVPNTAFHPFVSLSYLDLSGNLFTSLPRDFLGQLPTLHHLKVERCPRLSVISQDAFVSGWALQDLSLSQNPRLKVLPPAALAPLLALKSLDLSSCGLEGLQPTQVPMRDLQMLDISGNPLHCNCSLTWLAQVASNRTFSPGIPSCASPPALYGVPLEDIGAGACGSSVGPWTIAGCVGVAFSGALTILAFLICRWRKTRTAPPSTVSSKQFQICNDPQTSDFTHVNNDVPNMQVYSAPTYYASNANSPQFMFSSHQHQPRPVHSCPSDCACIRQSPALRPLLRSSSSTPTQSRILNNSPHSSAQSPNFVEFPPPPPTRPPPIVSMPHVPRGNIQQHYQCSPQYYTTNHHQIHHSPATLNNLNTPVYGSAATSKAGSPAHKQLLSTDWLYGPQEDNPHHWYASIDGSNSSAGAGNESSGYWEEDKELPTSSLLPVGVVLKENTAVLKDGNQEKDSAQNSLEEEEKRTSGVKEGVPTSYI